MRIYEIYDEENDLSIGTLLYYEKERSYIIELQDNLDEWTAPLLLTNYVKRKVFTIPNSMSNLWVKERVIPSGRQNLSSILKTHKLKEYDEMTFLDISEGRCSQDMLCIRKLNSLPDYVSSRMKNNITECSMAKNNNIICFFADNTVKKVDLSKLSGENASRIDENLLKDIKKILANPEVFETLKVGTGGYCISFNDSIEIPVEVLRLLGKTIPLTLNDFILFAQKNILDTSESSELLECSRQNLSYMVKENQLTPIKENVKGNLYLKGDILKNKW